MTYIYLLVRDGERFFTYLLAAFVLLQEMCVWVYCPLVWDDLGFLLSCCLSSLHIVVSTDCQMGSLHTRAPVPTSMLRSLAVHKFCSLTKAHWPVVVFRFLPTLLPP